MNKVAFWSTLISNGLNLALGNTWHCRIFMADAFRFYFFFTRCKCHYCDHGCFILDSLQIFFKKMIHIDFYFKTSSKAVQLGSRLEETNSTVKRQKPRLCRGKRIKRKSNLSEKSSVWLHFSPSDTLKGKKKKTFPQGAKNGRCEGHMSATEAPCSLRALCLKPSWL